MAKHTYCPSCSTELIDETRGGRERRLCPSCGYTFWDNPAPVVAALVEHDGDIILVRESGWPEKWFGLVTGFLERGEGPEEGVLRELEEELGLAGEVVELIGVYPFHPMHQIIIAYHVVATGEIALGEELESYKRVAKDKLRPWPMGTGQAVAAWLERHR